MLFGLTNDPAVLRGVMQHVLSGLNSENGHDFVEVYMLIFLRTMEEHIEHLKANLKLKPGQSIGYLGYPQCPTPISCGLFASFWRQRVCPEYASSLATFATIAFPFTLWRAKLHPVAFASQALPAPECNDRIGNLGDGVGHSTFPCLFVWQRSDCDNRPLCGENNSIDN